MESEHAILLASVIALGKVALGSTRGTRRWLQTPNVALDEIPFRSLQADVGARQVEAVLGRALLCGFS